MNDGDKSLVVQDETIINVAKRDMLGVVPLYYEMKKAKDELLTSDRMFTALTSAYKANIGVISNEITKIWNNDKPNVEAVKWLCCLNNFVIDFAKTLYMPEKPSHVEEELKKFSKLKLPHFFKYAKDKEEGQIDDLNDSTVNKLYKIIPNKPIQFKKVSGNCDYKLFMKNKYPKALNKEEIIETFIKINKNKRKYLGQEDYQELGFINHLKENLLELCDSEQLISDILVEYFYKKDSAYKSTLWSAYGEYIYENLLFKLQGTFCCEKCSNREEGKVNEKLCKVCKEEKIKESKRKHKEKGKKLKS